MKLKHLIFLFFFLAFISGAEAISIGVSPARLELEKEDAVASFMILNQNNETLLFSVKSQNNYMVFSKQEGKIKKYSALQINASLNPAVDITEGIYDDLISISVYRDKSNAFRNSAVIRARLNITRNISAVDYYSYDFNQSDAYAQDNLSNDTSPKTSSNIMTGFAILKNSSQNPLVGLGLVAVIFVLLYWLIRST